MKKLQLVFTFLFLLSALLVPFAVTSPAAAQATCVNFLGIPDDTVLGYNFLLSGYRFRAPAAGGTNMEPFVNVFTDIAGNPVHGVQFDDAGIRVRLPSPSATVGVRIGVFSAPDVTIGAFSAGWVLEDVAVVPADNLMHNITLTASNNPIVGLVFIGGGNEAVINQICS